jgi:hypothetical protein
MVAVILRRLLQGKSPTICDQGLSRCESKTKEENGQTAVSAEHPQDISYDARCDPRVIQYPNIIVLARDTASLR